MADTKDLFDGPPVEIPDRYVHYRKRWFILFIFCVTTIANAVTWITFSPINDKAIAAYGINKFWVNALSMVFMLLYVPFVFVSNWVLDSYTTRSGLLVGSILTTIGAWLRVTGAHSTWSFAVLFLGQSLCSIGQPFILNAVPQMSAEWFGDHERVIATTIASVANPIGVALGFVLPPLIVAVTVPPAGTPISDSVLSTLVEQCRFLMIVEAIICTAAAMLVVFVYETHPPTPPSSSQAAIELGEEEKETLTEATVRMFTDKDFWIIFAEFGIGLGAFNTLATVVGQLTGPYGYDDDAQSQFGAVVVVAGLVGAGLFGWFVDSTRRYKLALCVSLGLSAVFAAVTTLLMHAGNEGLLTSMFALIGFFMTPVLPLSLELAVELTFPIRESTSSGYLMTIGQIVGIGMIMMVSEVDSCTVQNIQNCEGVHTAMWVMCACIGLAFLLMLLYNGRLVRHEHEQAREEAQIYNLHEENMHRLANAVDA